MIMVLRLVASGAGVVKEIQELAERVSNGGRVTQEEIENARNARKKAVKKWDNTNPVTPESSD
jgi:hypothetical protein